MKPEQWLKVLDLWEQAKACRPEELDQWLDRELGSDLDLRAELISLLERHSAVTTSGKNLSDLFDFPSDTAPSDAVSPGDRLGPFRIQDEIGRGGMGVVFRGVREGEDFEQAVAIKILHPRWAGSRWEDRFIAERQILAGLDHSGIARLIDGGRHESGLLWVAMELVEGRAITDHCRDEGFSLSERLRLFREVCSAIEYAHGQLVVHRDIKPGNILVTQEGVVKVLDFGIAKLLGEAADLAGVTVTSDRAFTLNYASPEQIFGSRITVASDVYSLGVVLFELLTGTVPEPLLAGRHLDLSKSAGGSANRMPSRNVEADTPISARELRGDLDAVVSNAIEIDPRNRFGSVRELLEDLNRFRQGMPVRVRRASAVYRGVKFVRRNWVAVGLAFLLVFSVLGFGVMTWLNAKSLAKERDEVDRQRANVERTLHFLEQLFADVDPTESGEVSVVPEELIDQQVERARQSFDDEPTVQARLFLSLGRIYSDLGRWAKASPLLEQAVEFRRTHQGENHLETIEAQVSLGRAKIRLNELDEAEALLTGAVAQSRQRDLTDSLQLADSLDALSSLYLASGDFELAVAAAKESLALLRSELGENHERVAASMSMVSLCLTAAGILDEAEVHARDALAVTETITPDDSFAIAVNLSQLGRVLLDQGEFESACRAMEDALLRFRSVVGDEHPGTMRTIQNLAIVYTQIGDLAAAEDMSRQVRRIATALFGPEHPNVADALHNLAGCLRDQGKFVEAEAMMGRALEIRRAALGGPHPTTAITLNQLSNLARVLGRSTEAVDLSREALAMQEEHLGAEHPRVVATLTSLAQALIFEGELVLADEALIRALALAKASFGEDSFRIAFVERGIAELRVAQGRDDLAEVVYLRAIDRLTPKEGPGSLSAASQWRNLSELHLRSGRLSDAQESIAQALEILEAKGATDGLHWWLAKSVEGAVLAATGDRQTAEPLLVRSYEELRLPDGGMSVLTADAVERLVAAYEGWQESDLAERYRSLLGKL